MGLRDITFKIPKSNGECFVDEGGGIGIVDLRNKQIRITSPSSIQRVYRIRTINGSPEIDVKSLVKTANIELME